MAAGYVDLEITQGEDWTVQIQSLDDYNRPKPIRGPGRMDIKDPTGTIIHSLTTPTEDDDPLAIPSMAISSEVAIIQLHIPREVSSQFLPRAYRYDLWLTVDDDGAYAGPQITPE